MMLSISSIYEHNVVTYNCSRNNVNTNTHTAKKKSLKNDFSYIPVLYDNSYHKLAI